MPGRSRLLEDERWLGLTLLKPTLVLLCNVKDPVTGEAYSRDPRYIATKAEAYLKYAVSAMPVDFR